MRVPAGYNPIWRPLVWGLAALLGAGVALGQAPFGHWWLALIALTFLFPLALRTAPFKAGLAAGMGYGLVTMFWIIDPFFVEPEIYGWMAPFALFFMALGMGVFWALGMVLGAKLGAGEPSRALGMVLGLFAADFARSYIFTGFPWVLFGHIWLDTPVAQWASVVGALGLGLLTLGIAAAPWLVPVPGKRWLADLVAAVVLGLLWWGGEARLNDPLPERETPINLRILQPNAPQDLKWDPDYAEEFFFRHLDLTAEPPAEGKPKPDLILWPETAVPFLLNRPGAGLEMVAEAAQGTPVALGIQRGEGMRYYNSLAVVGAGGTVSATYDKVHLVPFGEYIPFGDAFAKIGITAFAAQAGNGYSAGANRTLLDLGPLGVVQPLICYEAVFAHEIQGKNPRPDWLLQITNDAWFGTSSGPYQHLAQARFRAIEFGLPLARSANTGVSALIDARGRMVESLPMGEQGVIDAPLPPSAPATIYAGMGDYPFLEGLAIVALTLFATARFARVDRRKKQV
ncbi:apolipoprotein N-acyltransferase [Rhodobacter sp. JA431]|uniref:apolipoprotein N-acyltransferase n=1 Tax=Rhodobacter sp. JA431 TaxID=570013 RepID=UPI000BCFEDA8|nr:apolipoprotein N-acyltransferase [Rhodobacter sp. JA431]SOC04530.1 apolipoprotein N-acyltransferase [Rhodobacter sp. JA431]